MGLLGVIRDCPNKAMVPPGGHEDQTYGRLGWATLQHSSISVRCGARSGTDQAAASRGMRVGCAGEKTNLIL